MIKVKRALPKHVAGIIKVCSEGYRSTYNETHSTKYIERIIDEFYNEKRVLNEVINTSDGWDGWYVAVEGNEVVGAIGGGLIGEGESEVFVLYLDLNRRGEEIGTRLLNVLTDIHKRKRATKQWVSVAKGNRKGIPFYEARRFEFVKEQKSFATTENENYLSLRYCREI